jgi:hypothetical protein
LLSENYQFNHGETASVGAHPFVVLMKGQYFPDRPVVIKIRQEILKNTYPQMQHCHFGGER